MHPKGANSMAASGLVCRKALLGTGWAIFLLFCMNRLPSGVVGPPFLTMMLFFSVCMGNHWPRAMTIVNKWVWFESRICREWLQ